MTKIRYVLLLFWLLFLSHSVLGQRNDYLKSLKKDLKHLPRYKKAIIDGEKRTFYRLDVYVKKRKIKLPELQFTSGNSTEVKCKKVSNFGYLCECGSTSTASCNTILKDCYHDASGTLCDTDRTNE